MKKIIKFTLKALFLIVFLGVVFIQYLKSDWNKAIDEGDLNNLKTAIANVKPLPPEFLKIYKSIYPITTTNGLLYNRITEQYGSGCPCNRISQIHPSLTKNNSTSNNYVLSWKLEKQVTQEQCLNYYLQNVDFLYNNKGVYEASNYYFQKELSELNFEQMATLIIMTNNPSLYNPKRRPELIKKRIKEIIRINKP
uniref:transglycosylase domain-containing protein n=1 Tax=Flavobacterium sp. TaxID=239 RepID=UPI0040479C08